jgi:hypothetical protein
MGRPNLYTPFDPMRRTGFDLTKTDRFRKLPISGAQPMVIRKTGMIIPLQGAESLRYVLNWTFAGSPLNYSPRPLLRAI